MKPPAWLTAWPIAHRGLHDTATPENSSSAANAAIRAGYAIECDVQMSRDGEAMVFHDRTFERLTDQSGDIGDFTTEDVNHVELRNGEPIPRLSAFLTQVAGRRPVIVEIKSRFDGDLRLARRVLQVVADYPGAVALMSFDPAILQELRWLQPSLPLGIVAETRFDHEEWSFLDPMQRHAMANLLHVEETQPDFLAWRASDLPCAAAHLYRRRGLPVLAWTVRDEATAKIAWEHADQIIFEGFRP